MRVIPKLKSPPLFGEIRSRARWETLLARYHESVRSRPETYRMVNETVVALDKLLSEAGGAFRLGLENDPAPNRLFIVGQKEILSIQFDVSPLGGNFGYVGLLLDTKNAVLELVNKIMDEVAEMARKAPASGRRTNRRD